MDEAPIQTGNQAAIQIRPALPEDADGISRAFLESAEYHAALDARACLQAAEDWGLRLGADLASLEFHAANIRASRFYRERMGYRAVSITAVKSLSTKISGIR